MLEEPWTEHKPAYEHWQPATAEEQHRYHITQIYAPTPATACVDRLREKKRKQAGVAKKETIEKYDR